MKYYADLYTWSDEKITEEISPDQIDDIVAAVEGQFEIINNVTGFAIIGYNYKHVDIYFKGADEK